MIYHQSKGKPPSGGREEKSQKRNGGGKVILWEHASGASDALTNFQRRKHYCGHVLRKRHTLLLERGEKKRTS